MDTKFTVKDRIVRDSLNAIELYRTRSGQYRLVVSGGIATQLYTYPSFTD